VLAGCAALSLAVGDAVGFVSASAEALSTLSWVVGWVLLTWAVIAGGAVAVHLVRAVVLRRRVAPIEVGLVVATVAVIAWTICTHPLAGSGAGTG